MQEILHQTSKKVLIYGVTKHILGSFSKKAGSMVSFFHVANKMWPIFIQLSK